MSFVSFDPSGYLKTRMSRSGASVAAAIARHLPSEIHHLCRLHARFWTQAPKERLSMLVGLRF